MLDFSGSGSCQVVKLFASEQGVRGSNFISATWFEFQR